MSFSSLRPALVLFVIMTLLLGVIYPVVTTLVGQFAFHDKANGSIIKDDQGRLMGSELLAQHVDDLTMFWGRPSATKGHPTNAMYSGASNLNPANSVLIDQIKARVEKIRAAHPSMTSVPVPVDLVTASGSGLDPHISTASAHFQISRIASACNIEEDVLKTLVQNHLVRPSLAFLGPVVVNVLKLNIDLYKICKPLAPQTTAPPV